MRSNLLCNKYCLFLLVFFFSGCAKLAHLQELLTLKIYSDEGDRKAAYVAARDRQFDLLRQAVQDGSVTRYSDTGKVRAAFGDPIMIEPGASAVDETWLYRYQVKFSGSPKVYLTFGKDGRLLTWKDVPGEDGIATPVVK